MNESQKKQLTQRIKEHRSRASIEYEKLIKKYPEHTHNLRILLADHNESDVDKNLLINAIKTLELSIGALPAREMSLVFETLNEAILQWSQEMINRSQDGEKLTDDGDRFSVKCNLTAHQKVILLLKAILETTSFALKIFEKDAHDNGDDEVDLIRLQKGVAYEA
tara:strand:- start:190 stop:684 length:495 start_codon:yes stop_codon:yes gene_type:complete